MNLFIRNIFRMSFLILVGIAYTSGGFDHGTSTGKGQLQLDLTWNPFNYFQKGQSYIVLGYGFTNNFDIHAYITNHVGDRKILDSYYYGLYYQFINFKSVDVATAIGKRKILSKKYYHIFFPQLLYNFKLKNDFSIGGSIVRVQKDSDNVFSVNTNGWHTFDIALFIPITSLLSKYKKIDNVKLGIGLFKTDLFKTYNNVPFLPTYSLDIKFKYLYD